MHVPLHQTYIGQELEFNLTWNETEAFDIGLAGYIFETNDSGSLVNSSYITMTGTQNISNYSIELTGNGGSTVGWRYYVNDTYGNMNESEMFEYEIRDKAIAMQITGFDDGINWTNLVPNIEDSPADGNNLAGSTEYYINVTESNGTTVNVYVSANDHLRSGANTVPLSNEQISNSTTDNTVPSTDNRSITTSYGDNKIGDGLSADGNVWMKFFITVPQYQAAGAYNNSVTFKAVMPGVDPDA